MDGAVVGDINCTLLVIGEKGSVTGQICAAEVRVLGSVTGHITAQKVHLARTARVVGNIRHDSLAVESGAFIEGRFEPIGHPALPAPVDAGEDNPDKDERSVAPPVLLLGS